MLRSRESCCQTIRFIIQLFDVEAGRQVPFGEPSRDRTDALIDLMRPHVPSHAVRPSAAQALDFDKPRALLDLFQCVLCHQALTFDSLLTPMMLRAARIRRNHGEAGFGGLRSERRGCTKTHQRQSLINASCAIS